MLTCGPRRTPNTKVRLSVECLGAEPSVGAPSLLWALFFVKSEIPKPTDSHHPLVVPISSLPGSKTATSLECHLSFSKENKKIPSGHSRAGLTLLHPQDSPLRSGCACRKLLDQAKRPGTQLRGLLGAQSSTGQFSRGSW